MSDWSYTVYGKEDVIRSRLPIGLTIGNFDGVHRGHQFVIQTLRDFADGLPLVALTFDPHPSQILSPANSKQVIEPTAERVRLMLSLGLDAVVVQQFSCEFAQLTADEFVFNYLVREFSVAKAVIGFDFCYGTERSGHWQHFQAAAARLGFDARRAEPFLIEGVPVSSSRIRSAVLAADFKLAEQLLGRPFSLSGVVVRGDQRGRLIGFPTANLGIDHALPLLPAHGVYAVQVLFDGESKPRFGVMNCGVRPTISSGLQLQVETHIFDFSGDIYGKKIAFIPKKFIRTEKKFSGLDELKEQIQSDSEAAKNFFGV
jgi:riboflavin kinase/FMN adenylyltransferase